MQDILISLAPALYEAVAEEREREVQRRSWLRRLKALQRLDTRKAEGRSVIVNRPAHLAGPHRL